MEGFPAKKGREAGGVKRHASSGKEDGKVTKKRKCGICGEEGKCITTAFVIILNGH